MTSTSVVKNVIADGLSRFPNEPEICPISAAISSATNSSAFQISCEEDLLQKIRASYADDAFCRRLLDNPFANLWTRTVDGLIVFGERLVIPRAKGLNELFCSLTHDTLGHFGTKKSNATLRQSYYWPGMHKDLENSYIPGCEECQRNKNSTRSPTGPLTETGLSECVIDKIIDRRRRGCGWQYLVRWVGYGPEDDEWLSRRELEECEALDSWLAEHGDH